jgi:hypothetical protein
MEGRDGFVGGGGRGLFGVSNRESEAQRQKGGVCVCVVCVCVWVVCGGGWVNISTMNLLQHFNMSTLKLGQQLSILTLSKQHLNI